MTTAPGLLFMAVYLAAGGTAYVGAAQGDASIGRRYYAVSAALLFAAAAVALAGAIAGAMGGKS